MGMDWDEYVLDDRGVRGRLAEQPRSVARQAFDRLMHEKPARVEVLRRLLRANGLELNGSDDGIQELNEWFVRSVEADPDHPGRLAQEWYSVAHDVALFLGDVMIDRCPQLRWDLFTGGKKDAAYHRHIITGFTKVPNKKYNIDIAQQVVTYAHRVIVGRGSIPHYGSVNIRGIDIDVDAAAARVRRNEVEPDAFWQWIRKAEMKA
jgi:hypothetical protein